MDFFTKRSIYRISNILSKNGSLIKMGKCVFFAYYLLVEDRLVALKTVPTKSTKEFSFL